MRNLIFISSFIILSFAAGVFFGFTKGGTPKAFAKNYPSPAEEINVLPTPEGNTDSSLATALPSENNTLPTVDPNQAIPTPS